MLSCAQSQEAYKHPSAQTPLTHSVSVGSIERGLALISRRSRTAALLVMCDMLNQRYRNYRGQLQGAQSQAYYRCRYVLRIIVRRHECMRRIQIQSWWLSCGGGRGAMGGSHYCCCIFAISVQVLLLLPLTHAASCTVSSDARVHAMRSAHTRQCHYSNVPWYRYSEYWQPEND